MSLITIGPISEIVLLGGGSLLRSLCMWALSETIPLKVISSPRHADEIIDDENLVNFLVRKKINHIVVNNISDESVKRFLGSGKNTFYLSLGAAWIFEKQVIIDLFNSRLFNLGSTRLPQNRGGGGFSWRILTGNPFGFCVLHLVDEGEDTGAIALLEEFIYPSSCRKPIDFEEVYVKKNLAFLTSFIKKHQLRAAKLEVVQQSEYFSTYWPRLSTNLNGWIDWSLNAAEIESFICAFDDPYDGAQTYLNGDVVHLKGVSLNRQDGVFHSYQSGIIFRKGESWLCIAVTGCSIVIETVLDSKGKDYFQNVKVGDRFVTPHAEIEKARTRPIYTPLGLKLDRDGD